MTSPSTITPNRRTLKPTVKIPLPPSYVTVTYIPGSQIIGFLEKVVQELLVYIFILTMDLYIISS